MARGVREADPARYRTVVMLRWAERDKLDRLARKADVSGAEIVRRAILAYDPLQEDPALVDALVETLHASVNEAIQSTRRAQTTLSSALRDLEKRPDGND